MNPNQKELLKQETHAVLRKFFFSTSTLDECFRDATAGQLAFVQRMAKKELVARQISRRHKCVKTAGFPVLKTFDDYDFSGIIFPNLLSKDEMLTLQFIDDRKSLVWFGGCGTGKTHAMTALGLMACNKDYKVKFFTVSQLVLLLKKALYDGTLETFLSILRAQDVLLLDELGYIPMDLESAQLLFRVVSESYERKALIITTNLPFSEWGKMFTDDELAAAMIDRIVHYGHLINTGNKDWRLENSLMLDKVRKK